MSQLWRLEIQNQGVPRTGFSGGGGHEGESVLGLSPFLVDGYFCFQKSSPCRVAGEPVGESGGSVRNSVVPS